MNNINEACNAIRGYLENWYNNNKHRKDLSGSLLHQEKQNFIKLNPEYEQYDRGILTGFDSYNYKPGCLEGCCIERCSVRGIYAEVIDWERIKRLSKDNGKKYAEVIDWSKINYAKLNAAS